MGGLLEVKLILRIRAEPWTFFHERLPFRMAAFYSLRFYSGMNENKNKNTDHGGEKVRNKPRGAGIVFCQSLTQKEL